LEENRILGKDASNGGTNLHLVIRDNAGHVGFGLGIGSGGTSVIQTSTNLVPRDTWTHIAATYDGSLMKIYINGVLDSSLSWTSGFSSNDNPLTIGAKNPPYLERFIMAKIDEVKIFNRALSQVEIQREMEGPRVPTLTLTPSSGFAATTVVGSGFSPNSTVSVTWDGTQIPTVPSPLITDANGNFTAIISVPTQNATGAHTVKAIDVLGIKANATFTVVDMTGPQGKE